MPQFVVVVRALILKARAARVAVAFASVLSMLAIAGRCQVEPAAAQISECSQPGGCEDWQMCRRAPECAGDSGDACSYDAHCLDDLVCITQGTTRSCRPPSCANGVQDAGETRVDCGGPCRACVGCEQACDVGDPIDPPAIATLSFNTGTYARNSVGGYLPDVGVVEIADPNELRWASVSGGRMALFEGASTNLLLNSGTLTGSGWSTAAPTSPTAPAVAPDGMSSTKVIQYNNGADAFSLAQSVFVTPPTKLSFSLFARSQLAAANVPLLISEVDSTGFDFAFGREVRPVTSSFGRIDLAYNRLATPPMDGLYSWFRADRCRQDAQTRWYCDNHGPGPHFVSNLGMGPFVLLSTGLNGQPALSSSGPASFGAGNAGTPTTNEFVMAFVGAFNGVGPFIPLMSWDTLRPDGKVDRSGFSVLGPSTTKTTLYWGCALDYGGQTTNCGNITGPTIPVSTPFAAVIRSSAAGTQLFVNGALVGSSPLRAPATKMMLSLITGTTGVRVADLSFYQRTLSDPEIGQLHAYFKERYNIGPTVASSGPQQTIASISHAGLIPDSGRRPAVPSDPYHVWGAQLEEQAFPTSYIPTETTPVTRAADQLVYTAAQVPEWVRTGTFQFDVAPLYSSTEMKVNQAYRLFAFQNGDGLSLVRDATGSYARLRSGGVDTSFPITWSRYQRLTFTLARATNQFSVEGALTGNGSFAGAGAFGAEAMRVGGAFAGGDEAFAAISELRQVVGVVASCPVDTSSGCAQCGNGVVEAGEQCDPAADPRCNAQCVIDELTPCDPAAPACAPGQVCPSTPNGPVFGAGHDKTFCIPSGPCLNTPTPACGTVDSACGICACTPSCGGKQCGDDPADGCGGVCAGFCDRGEPGCVSDTDCGPGFLCGQGNAWRFNAGAAPGSAGNACWPAGCEDIDPRRVPCGTVSDECGRCDPVVAGGCYEGPLCNKGTGSCAAGSHENEVGACVTNDPTSNADDVVTSAIGALPGDFAVSPSGAATYRVPIAVPPGRGGLAPEMSLTYNSAAGNGMLGLGWSLTGFSSIGVCSGTIAQDGSLNDREVRYCLDGQRIIPVEYSSQTQTTEWRTEFDSFTRITSPGDHFHLVSSVDHTPQWFIAESRDGRVMKYGTTADSRMGGVHIQSGVNDYTTVRQWALAEISDRAQNKISIKYAKFTEPRSDGTGTVDVELLPRWLGYNFELAGGDRAMNEVVLGYDGAGRVPLTCHFKIFNQNLPANCPRPDRLHGFSFGEPIAQTRRLKSAQIRANGKPTREYRLGYDVSNNGVSILESITECAFGRNSQVSACRAPTEFSYEDASVTLAAPQSVSGIGNRQQIGLDWNSDGYEDLAVYQNGAWSIHLGSSSGLLSAVAQVLTPSTRRDVAGVDSYRLSQAFATDFDADGHTDFIVETEVSGRLNLERFEFDGGASSILIPSSLWPAGEPRKNASFVPFDPDGDGLIDVLYCTGTDQAWWVLPNTGGAFGTPKPVGSSSGYCDGAVVVNHSDGRQAVVIGNPTKSSFEMVDAWYGGTAFFRVAITGINLSPRSHYIRSVLDINGDGQLDLLLSSYAGGSGEYHWFLNAGVYPHEAFGGKWVSGGSGQSMRIANADNIGSVDFDRDGHDDLLVSTKSGDTTEWALYRGTDLSKNPMTLTSFADTPSIQVIDANGDGRQDYVGGSRVFYNSTPQANLLRTITVRAHADDVPDLIEVDYATGVAPEAYTQGAPGADCARPGASEVCLRQLPHPSVRTYTRRSFLQDAQNPSVSREVSAEFGYINAVADRRGRGFLGFSARTIGSEGFGGVDQSVTREDYDLRRVKEPQGGPFVARDPVLATSPSYAYYYYPFAGRVNVATTVTPLPASEVAVGFPNVLLVRTDRVENTFVVLRSDKGHPYVALEVSEVTTHDGSTPISEIQTGYTYDLYGNVQNSWTTWLPERNHFVATERVYAHEGNPSRVNDWQVDLLSALLVTEGAPVSGPGSSLVTLDTFSYTEKGLIERIDHGVIDGNAKLIEKFDYLDAWNNINLVTQTPGGLFPPAERTPRVYSYRYDELGVYLETAVNSAGHIETFDYSYVDGQLRSYLDPNEFEFSWKYDGFGRQVEAVNAEMGLASHIADHRGSERRLADPAGECRRPGHDHDELNALVQYARYHTLVRS